MGISDLDDHDSTVPSLEAQVKELETKEAQLLPVLQTCQESLRRVRLSLAQIRNRKIPISRLSDDVLALIFEAGPRWDPVVDNYFRNRPADGHSLPFAVLVSHVSSTWRAVAIRDPFLWTTIKFIYPRPLDFYFMYVQRSKSCNLDIHFICEAEKVPDFNPSILQLLRCRHLTIIFRWYRSAFHVFRHLTIGTAPHLVSLKISMNCTNNGSESAFPYKRSGLFGGGAPLLSSVNMRGVSFRLCQPPLGALTKLELCTDGLAAELTEYEFFDVFTALAPTLTALRIAGIILRVESEDNIFAVELPVLVSLCIRYADYFDEDEDDENGGNYISNLWSCINVPALKSLTLRRMDKEQFRSIMANLRLQKMANATTDIKSLCLHDVDVQEYAKDLAMSCPNISNLRLVQDTIHTIDSVLEFILESDQKSITSNTDAEPLFHNLHTLSVQLYEDDTLRDLVLGRKAVGHPLMTLRLADHFANETDWYRQHVETVQVY